MTKLFDTFIYAGEKEFLIARVSQLNSFVNHFVIVESKFTFSGRPREVDDTFRQQVLDEFGSKIRWVVLDSLAGSDAWQRESNQRNHILSGLQDIAPGDLILLSDVDEIPSIDFILHLKDLDSDDVLIAEMKLFRYCAHFESSENWHGTIATRYSKEIPDLQSLRLRAVRFWLEDQSKIFKNGGFHFTTFLNAREFRIKIKSFSHTELDIFPFNNVFFLYLILKLGFGIDGKEIFKINKQFEKINVATLCTSDHKFDKWRLKLAKRLQPVIQSIFEKRVSSLSSPN